MKEITELIREEAYLISKVREKFNLLGTPLGDWIEAEDKFMKNKIDDMFSENLKAYARSL